MRKKFLIIGNGAKEYAFAKKISELHDVYITPASDMLKEFATCLDIREDNINELLDFVMENDIDMTIALSSKAIDADIATKFANNKLQIFAPTAKAHELVSNKMFAKKVLYKLRIPTPKFGIFEKINLANDYIKNKEVPFVIKTNDNNSAVVITSQLTAKTITETIFLEKNNKIMIEDYVYGTPFCFYTLTDGYKAIPIGSSLLYKYSLEGDGGQLTTGMGACIPNYKLSIDNEYFLMDNVIYPTIDYLQMSGNPYLGILGVNGIITDNGDIFILGWQSFMQDCDAAAILENINEDVLNLIDKCIIGSFSDDVDYININDNSAVSVVLRCNNKEKTENIIHGMDCLNDSTIITYYPTVKKNKYLESEANNGSVFVLTALATSVSRARETVYDDISYIDFNGMYYRNDICKINI